MIKAEEIWSPNFRHAEGREISAIVIHYTGSMSLAGTLAWFEDKSSQVSAHYVIGREGRLIRMVHEEDVAWHAGSSSLAGRTNVNNFSIGIELVGTQDSRFTCEQMAKLYELLEDLVRRYRISSKRVVGHADVSPGRKIDPDGLHGQFNWVKTRAVVDAVFPGKKV